MYSVSQILWRFHRYCDVQNFDGPLGLIECTRQKWLDFTPKYFTNAVHVTCTKGSHEILAHGDVCDIASAAYQMIRSEDKQRILQTTR